MRASQEPQGSWRNNREMAEERLAPPHLPNSRHGRRTNVIHRQPLPTIRERKRIDQTEFAFNPSRKGFLSYPLHRSHRKELVNYQPLLRRELASLARIKGLTEGSSKGDLGDKQRHTTQNRNVDHRQQTSSLLGRQACLRESLRSQSQAHQHIPLPAATHLGHVGWKNIVELASKHL